MQQAAPIGLELSSQQVAIVKNVLLVMALLVLSVGLRGQSTSPISGLPSLRRLMSARDTPPC